MRPFGGIFTSGDFAFSAALGAMADALLERGLDQAVTHIVPQFGWVGAIRPHFDTPPTGIPESAGDLLIIADCRIDGRSELIEALACDDLSAESSDEELVLAGYRKWGPRCPEHLIGDYAFAIFDRSRKILFCARDHVGARPFFYAAERDRFFFASDFNAILAVPGFDDRLDETTIATALSSRRYRPLDATFFHRIRKLPPGHSLIVRDGRASITRYWWPGKAGRIRLAGDHAYAERLRELFEMAVADRLRGGRQYGIHLSGGLDSTSVASLAVPALRASGRPDPIGYSWHRLDPGADPATEPAWSEAARARVGIDLVAPLPESASLVELLRRDWTRNPDPANLGNELPVQIAAAESGVEIMLSGWGGDQAASFEGRGYHVELLWRGRLPTLWRETGARSARQRVRRTLSVGMQLASELLRFKDPVGRSFARKDFQRAVPARRVFRVRKHSVRRTMRDLFANGAITTRLEDWALSGARRGIEYRYPLLDRRIMDFCYGVPTHLFLRGGVSRWLMREAMADLLPPTVADYASKSEPVRAEALAPALLDAFAVLAREVAERRGAFDRARYIDVDALLERLNGPWSTVHGQAPVSIALQLLDFDAPAAKAER